VIAPPGPATLRDEVLAPIVVAREGLADGDLVLAAAAAAAAEAALAGVVDAIEAGEG
jgi:hypothetical protein